MLGLLNEIVRARQTLTAYMAIEMNPFQRLNFYAYGRKTYDLKVNTIKNCLFACDLEPSATDITKLRLWLSIVIDDETVKQDNSDGMFDVHTEPRQLPNLDCNVICGNSLMDTFEGIPLITKSSLLDNQEKVGMDSFYQAGFDNMLSELIKLQDELYFTKEHESKKQIKKQIHNIYDKIILHQLEGSTEAARKYEKIKNYGSQPFILWQLYFPKVFQEKHGFDIAIGNPPYISAPSQLADVSLSENRRQIVDSKKYVTLHSKWDLYIPFMELGIQLLHDNGVFSMIVPYPLTNQIYGKKLREYFTEKCDMYKIVDLSDVKIFDAVVQNCIPFVRKHETQRSTEIVGMIDGNFVMKYCLNHDKMIQDKKTKVWNLIKRESVTEKLSFMHVLGDYCYISVGMVPNADEKKAKGEFTKADLISDIKDDIPRREYIEAKDIEKYDIVKFKYIEYGTDRSPQKLRRPTFKEFYEPTRIMFNRLGELKGVYDENHHFLHNDSVIACVLWKDLHGVKNKSISSSVKKFSTMTREDMETLSKTIDLRYLLGVMNSEYAAELLRDQRAGDYHIYPEHLRKVPIPPATNEEQSEIVELVNIALNDKNTRILEEINEKVKRLYENSVRIEG